jgi:hypothetical protein
MGLLILKHVSVNVFLRTKVKTTGNWIIGIKLFYSLGEFCELGNCASQPTSCLTDFGPSFCVQSEIRWDFNFSVLS